VIVWGRNFHNRTKSGYLTRLYLLSLHSIFVNLRLRASNLTLRRHNYDDSSSWLHLWTNDVARSPLTEDLNLLKQTVLFTEDDEKYLRLAGEVLADQIDAVSGCVVFLLGSHPHLAQYFSTPDNQLIDEYLAVRKRFYQWILDTCNRSYDQTWLTINKKLVYGIPMLRKSNRPCCSVPILDCIAFISHCTTIKPFLAIQGHNVEEVEKMHQAWFKSVTLQVTLWVYPYAKETFLALHRLGFDNSQQFSI